MQMYIKGGKLMGLNERIKDLVSDIKSTREFIELKQARADLAKYRDLKNQIEELQKKQMELFRSNKHPQEVEYLANELNRQFQSLSKIPEVDRMMKAGTNFNQMITKLYQDINTTLDVAFKS